jgi:proteasome lid subunit RPN8/RPN11
VLSLTPEVLAHIAEEGRRSYPHECCGFLLGAWGAERREVLEAQPADNARTDSPQNRYLIPPEVFLHVQKAAESRLLDVVGFYHSHPDVAAEPSAFDREHAWPGYSYVIVSVRAGAPRETRSWVLDEDRAAFREEPLAVAGAAAPPSAIKTSEPRSS